MLQVALKKTLYNLAVCLALYTVVRQFSRGGPVYAGWLVGFLGACYLLAAWLAFLRSKGSRSFRGLKRTRPQQPPHSLRNPGYMARRGPGLFGPRYPEDDSLEEESEDEPNGVPEHAHFRVRAMVYGTVGVLMLILSAV